MCAAVALSRCLILYSPMPLVLLSSRCPRSSLSRSVRVSGVSLHPTRPAIAVRSAAVLLCPDPARSFGTATHCQPGRGFCPTADARLFVRPASYLMSPVSYSRLLSCFFSSVSCISCLPAHVLCPQSHSCPYLLSPFSCCQPLSLVSYLLSSFSSLLSLS